LAQYHYPLQNPALPVEATIDHIISIITTEKKETCLYANFSIPRFGINDFKHVEKLHGSNDKNSNEMLSLD
jgi:hypothetical protein